MWKNIHNTDRNGKPNELTSFNNCIDILINKPQVINRRLVGSNIEDQFYFGSTILSREQLINFDPSTVDKSHDISTATRYRFTKCRLLFKDLQRYPNHSQITIQDTQSMSAIFYAKDTTSLIYSIVCDNDTLELDIYKNESESDNNINERYHSETWLRHPLLTSVDKWMDVEALNTKSSSLTLVAVERYDNNYRRMKNEYADALIEAWPETTDPEKYVYEDIAIAAYLITYWQTEYKDEKPSFVDVGCGNGLLVYLLNKEGYPGIGIDLRKRKIWDSFYGSSIILKEQAIEPDNYESLAGFDWLIGNHSDELTPWIPIIASKLSYATRCFLLPCCLWSPFGRFNCSAQRSEVKNTAINSKTSTSPYQLYLDYIQNVICKQMCGFQVDRDSLRIPSTKKVCLICTQRDYKETHWSDQIEDIENALKTIEDNCRREFKVRSEEVAKTKNCSTCDSSIVNEIVKKVFAELLKNRDDERLISLPNGRVWDSGASLDLSSVVALFSAECLLNLKSECGGMQTLLRNNHSVFQVSGGKVKLRNWLEASSHDLHQKNKRKHKPNISDNKKTKQCYMFHNHPDACPLNSEQCRFAHGYQDFNIHKSGTGNF